MVNTSYFIRYFVAQNAYNLHSISYNNNNNKRYRSNTYIDKDIQTRKRGKKIDINC